MLCLSRSAGQTIHVGSDIVIKVLGVVNGVVRLGLEAPSEVKILRGELERFTWEEEADAGADDASRGRGLRPQQPGRSGGLEDNPHRRESGYRRNRSA